MEKISGTRNFTCYAINRLIFIVLIDNYRCYALELCEVSLDEVYKDPKKYRKFLPNQVEFILQLSLGLEYIHSQNLVHRDIKSGNVLLSKPVTEEEPPLAKWADFGFAKTTSNDGKYDLSGRSRGTELYWAPEICRIWEDYEHGSQESDDKKLITMTVMSDVFSSGCVFFEFCTEGTHPFGDKHKPIQIKDNLLQSNPYNLKGNVISNAKSRKEYRETFFKSLTFCH